MKTLIIALLLSVGLNLEAVAQTNINTHGLFMVVKGTVAVIPFGSQKSEPAKVGKKIFPGDSIITGKDSRAKVVMSDKNTLNISPDSKFKLEKYENNPIKNAKNVEISLEYGKIRASVAQKYDGQKNKFQIKTPAAVAGVRGTDFLTSHSKATNATQITTFEGVVAFGPKGPNGDILTPVLVQPGQTSQAEAGKPPEPPKAVPQEELKSIETESSADTASNVNSSAEEPNAKQEPAQEKQDAKDEKKSEVKESKETGESDKSDKKGNQETAKPSANEPEAKKDNDSGQKTDKPSDKKPKADSPKSTDSNRTRDREPANANVDTKTPQAPPSNLITSDDMAGGAIRNMPVNTALPLPVLPVMPTIVNTPKVEEIINNTRDVQQSLQKSRVQINFQ
jgi:hypothetical protein